MKIFIMGASCAGSTTLGSALAGCLNVPYFDTDNYFWQPSAVPYTVKRDPLTRNHLLTNEVKCCKDYIIGGSLVSWGEEWKTHFDLVVFLYVPPKIRIERLIAREMERYGDDIYTNPERKQLFETFIAWAKRYEDRTFTGRNIQIHENWLNQINCPVLEIRGNTSVEERVELVMKKIKMINLSA